MLLSLADASLDEILNDRDPGQFLQLGKIGKLRSAPAVMRPLLLARNVRQNPVDQVGLRLPVEPILAYTDLAALP